MACFCHTAPRTPLLGEKPSSSTGCRVSEPSSPPHLFILFSAWPSSVGKGPAWHAALSFHRSRRQLPFLGLLSATPHCAEEMAAPHTQRGCSRELLGVALASVHCWKQASWFFCFFSNYSHWLEEQMRPLALLLAGLRCANERQLTSPALKAA